MIELVQARRAQPILIAVPQPSVAGVFLSSLTDASFYAEIAKRKKIPLVENALSGTLSKAELKLDQLHPNDEGHRRIAADVLVALRKQGIAR
jgi:acyl-CoA hydrolase